jgi:integrase/recombinase XerD
MTAMRSLFSYLKTYGYTGANPAHSDFVAAPAVPRDGKTVGLSPHDCRRLLEAPQVEDPAIKDEARRIIPVGIRDRALLAVLAYSGCRVGELVKLKVRDFCTNGEHRVLNVSARRNHTRVAGTRARIHDIERRSPTRLAAGGTHAAPPVLVRPAADRRQGPHHREPAHHAPARA